MEVMNVNYSFGLLKPDCLKRGIGKEVLALVESAGLEIIITKRVRLTKNEVDVIWAPCLNEDFYEEFLKFSLSGDCLVFIVKGADAIKRFKGLVGHYDPALAEKHTIRHRFGKTVRENVIHGADTEEQFWKEASLFFTRAELNRLLFNQAGQDYKRPANRSGGIRF
jgi:nucleoside-diphosphate kinase